MKSSIITPAFVFDEKNAFEKVDVLGDIRKKNDLKILFTIKAFSIYSCLDSLIDKVDGFSASSLFEAQLAADIIGGRKSIHLNSPLFDIPKGQKIPLPCDYLAFNSLSQMSRWSKQFDKSTSIGIRVNPGISFVDDKRYNPCRTHSKLGVPMDKLVSILNNGSDILAKIKGIHFHTNCESSDFSQLWQTVKHIDAQIPKLLQQVEWVNLGGGYLFDESDNMELLSEAVYFLKNKYDVEVFIEPGKGIVGKAGYIVSSVVDIFESDGKNIAVLDTTVNHMPEVFEYQYKPDIMEESRRGKYKYILAGATCLAGDLFGEYSFKEPLEIGSRITFQNMGAYTLVKANMFNGINLPTIYSLTHEGELKLIKEFTYEDFLSRCGVTKHVPA